MKTSKLCILFSLALFGCASNNAAHNSQENEVRFSVLIGSNGIDCGTIDTWPFPKNRIHGKERVQKESIACVQKAKALGQSFVVTSEVSMPPDSWITRTYIFTKSKEHVLIEESELGDSGIQGFIGRCENIELLNTGKIEAKNCSPAAELFNEL